MMAKQYIFLFEKLKSYENIIPWGVTQASTSPLSLKATFTHIFKKSLKSSSQPRTP